MLHSFSGADGVAPKAGLVQARDRNFYGTTNYGGAGSDGTAFKITPSGTLTTLYKFCKQPNCADGATPAAALVQATDGNFYGTTAHGGLGNIQCSNGCGTVFKITPSGTLTTLYKFCSQTYCADGYYPGTEMVQATDGNFYGTTWGSDLRTSNAGTVFGITPSGTLTTVYNFCSQPNCADGQAPFAGLVQATDGNFYGTTYAGGAHGSGTVFKLSAPYSLSVSKNGNGTVTSSDGNINCGPTCPICTPAGLRLR